MRNPNGVHCLLGVDPGVSGAIAYFFPDRPDHIVVQDVPVVDGQLDPVTLARRIDQMRPTLAVVERVAAMPKQGVSSTFKFGMAYGMMLGIIATQQIPLHLVTPARWKKAFNLSADKEQARALAIRLWPGCEDFALKKWHGRAEAALIARYGVQLLERDKAA
jgi:hypothetical protein